MVVRSQFGRKTTSQASSIDYQVVFGIGFGQVAVYKLHIIEHVGFSSFSCALSKAPVVHEYYVIIIPVKIPGIPCPSFNTSSIPMEVKYQTPGMFPVKMQTIDAYTRSHIKIQFPERNVIYKLKIRMELLGFENKQVLEEIDRQGKYNDPSNDIVNDSGQAVLFALVK
jgi:hypothetical protein